MDNKILLLAAKMLNRASNEFSNNGCNDLDSDVIELGDDKLCKEFNEWNVDKNWVIENISEVPDWLLMDFLEYKLIEATNNE